MLLQKKDHTITGRTIVITGASSGIGKCLLDRLAADKSNRILAASRSVEKLTGFGDNVVLYNCDLSSKEGVDALFEKAESIFDKVDLVIANAGAPYYEKMDYVNWNRITNIFSLNTVSPIYTYQKYLKHLAGRNGQLAFTISAMGEMAIPGYALYTSTKFAMKGFQEAIRLEAPKNLKLTAVYPVSTATNFFNVGGGGVKMSRPFPVQEADVVADRMIEGIAMGKKHIYPCKIFRPSKLLMNTVPPVKSVYWGIEKKRLSNFLKRKEKEEK